MVDFTSIAIFLLGTTTLNSKYPQVYRTYYESRILPIHETWSTFFPHLYFVFGTNTFDNEFLATRCKVVESDSQIVSASINEHRRRLPRSRQVRPRQEAAVYHCPVHPDQGEGRWANYIDYSGDYLTIGANGSIFDSNFQTVINSSLTERELDTVRKAYLHSHRNTTFHRPIKVLYPANCTGEYFGVGPTCRCQESIRYFLRHSETKTGKFKDIKWFLFLDDDVYIRPFGLISLLRTLEQNTSSVFSKSNLLSIHDHPIALVSAQLFHGLHLKPKQGTNVAKEKCRRLMSVDYCFAQPALMNKQALLTIKTSIDNNGMTLMHPIWGGSHDSILGLTLWMYQIPTYSFGANYLGHIIYMRPNVPLHTTVNQFIGEDHFLMFHRIMSMNAMYTTPPAAITNEDGSPAKPKLHSKGLIPNQYDVAKLVDEVILYRNDTTLQSVSFKEYYNVIQKQWGIGKQAAQKLIPMMNTEAVTKVSTTSFASELKVLKTSFVMFKPEHC